MKALRDWNEVLVDLQTRLGGDEADRRAYLEADIDMVERTIRGLGPDDPDSTVNKHGARIVFNISSSLIPSFCGDGYKNAYDLGKSHVGDQLGTNPPRRTRVDGALASFFEINQDEIYFGALELNGSGIRFYGDICLVLKPSPLDAETNLLDRNSYDLLRQPLRGEFERAEPDKATDEVVRKLAGKWARDVSRIAAIKILQSRTGRNRRLTTAQVSLGILDDEDYVEILKIGRFDVTHLEEARVSTADISGEAFIDSKLRTGDDVSAEELTWRDYRRQARQALRMRGVAVRAVTHPGRVR